MTNFEKNLLSIIERKKNVFFIIIITILGVIVRTGGRDYVSGDAKYCLLPWYEMIKESGGLSALKEQVGNYGIPYQFLIAIMTYIPVEALYVYKLFSCIFDFGLALISAKFVCALANRTSSFLFSTVYGIVLFLPTVVLNSSVWAQCDAIYVFFVMAALYCLFQKKDQVAFIFIGIAFAFKLQTIFIIPFFIYYYIKEKRFSILNFGISLFSFYIMQIPGFLCGRSFLEPIRIYVEQGETYKEMTLNFTSFWVLVGNDYESLHLIAIVLTISILGIGLFWLMYSSVKMDNADSFMKLLIWSVWTCLLFLPAMHERYGYLLDLLLILYVFLNKRGVQYAVIASICSVDRYARFLYGGGVDIKLVSIAYTLAYLDYTYRIVIRNSIISEQERQIEKSFNRERTRIKQNKKR